MEGAGAHLHVVRLQNDASPFGPIALKGKNQILKGARRRPERVDHGREYSDAPPGVSCVAKADISCTELARAPAR
jgi:hypothetical protein